MDITSHENNIKAANLLVYSCTHALIDGSCAAIIAANIAWGKMDLVQISFYIVLYNTIAFALQVPIGLMADKIRKPAETAMLGCFLVLIGVLTYKNVSFALIIAGLGNALFHVGGGITALYLKPGKASLPGIFVSTGALGLLIGTIIGKSKYFSIWSLAIILISAAAFIFIIKKPSIDYNFKIEGHFNNFSLILTCILASIAIRGLVGFMLTYPWKANLKLLIIFTVAVALGKALGGILGDYFGWTRVTVYGLLISAPLLLLGMDVHFLGIAGVFLFNLTMPVTLVVTANMLPGRTGFAFGLTTLALIIGAFPTFTALRSILCENNGLMIFAAVLLMVLLLKLGLKLYFSKDKITVVSNKSFNK